MANLTNLINGSLSTQVIRLTPGESVAEFDVIVINESDQFATFLLDLEAPGTETAEGYSWYQLSPEVSTKKPPGDRTVFHVTLTDNPIPGFVGTLNLTVRIFSLELPDEERLLMRAVVSPGKTGPVRVELPVSHFQVDLGDRLAIPVEVYNPNQSSVQVLLRMAGPAANWLSSPLEESLLVAPGSERETTFVCQIPNDVQVLSQAYPLTLEASQPHGLPITAEGTIEVMAHGTVTFGTPSPIQSLPRAASGDLAAASASDSNAPSTTFDLTLENASNLAERVRFEVGGRDAPDVTIAVNPTHAGLQPGQVIPVQVTVEKRQPWLGWQRHLLFEVSAALSDSRINLQGEVQHLELRVRPKIPAWLQAIAAVLLLLLGLSLLPGVRRLHEGPVTDLQLVSASSDQTIRRWRVGRHRLYPAGVLVQANKAIRVVRQQPGDRAMLAAGLENGEIQLWDRGQRRPPSEPLHELTHERADRVLGLEFTPDGQHLFSGHGSGLVAQWQTDPVQPVPLRTLNVDFAIYDLALVGGDRGYLAIAGRYNRLQLWDWTTDQRYALPYRPGDPSTYIQSLATVPGRPTLVAAADTQGYISLWDVSDCAAAPAQPSLAVVPTCGVALDEWNTGHGGQSVRALAFTEGGCQLASVGDDRRVMLWPLLPRGDRDLQAFNGIEVDQFPTTLNAVAATTTPKEILLTTGGDDHSVRLSRLPLERLQEGGDSCGTLPQYVTHREHLSHQ